MPAIAVLLAAALAGGCGQKGPLWVPGHAKNTPWPMKPAGTAADAAPTPPATEPAGTPKDADANAGAKGGPPQGAP
jgi:predicted small lipoprotein YifL